MTRGQAIAHAARGWIGVRFRPQGRCRDGIDCIGLAGAAIGLERLPHDYALRGGSREAVARGMATAGLDEIAAAAAGEGDLLLCLAGPRQWHLVVLTEQGFVHADAGLRRVAEVPGRPRWPVAGAWRVRGE